VTRTAILLTLTLACAAPKRPENVDLSFTRDDLSILEGDLAQATPLDLAQASADLRHPDLLAAGDLGVVPHGFASPGTAPTDATLGWNGSYATSYHVALGADQPGALLYYTTDGSTPSLTSTHGAAPLGPIAIASTTRLRWFAASAAGMESPHDDSYGVDASLQTKAGFVIYDVSVDTQGPVAVVSAGGTLAASATFRFWYQSTGCSGGTFPCAAELVYGVDKVDQGCLFDEHDGGANNFAASSVTTKSFNVTIPATPGEHDVQVAQIEDLTCAQAMSAMALATRPNLVRIAVVLVR
jgi:Chitobiase/beta-hexosaminidase C-terminal domain